MQADEAPERTEPTSTVRIAPRSLASESPARRMALHRSQADFSGAPMTRPPRLGSRSARVELGLMAFSPALALLAFRARGDAQWVLLFGIPTALGVLVAVVGTRVVRRGNPEMFDLESIEDASDEVIGHVGSYLLPAVVDVSQSSEQAVIAAVALALIIQIHVATGRVHVNPLLYLLGYRTYRATTANGVAYYLIAYSDVSGWDRPHRLVPLGDSILVERRRDAKAQG